MFRLNMQSLSFDQLLLTNVAHDSISDTCVLTASGNIWASVPDLLSGPVHVRRIDDSEDRGRIILIDSEQMGLELYVSGYGLYSGLGGFSYIVYTASSILFIRSLHIGIQSKCRGYLRHSGIVTKNISNTPHFNACKTYLAAAPPDAKRLPHVAKSDQSYHMESVYRPPRRASGHFLRGPHTNPR